MKTKTITTHYGTAHQRTPALRQPLTAAFDVPIQVRAPVLASNKALQS
jgi:hypothetical protein